MKRRQYVTPQHSGCLKSCRSCRFWSHSFGTSGDGVLLSGEGVGPSSQGARLTVDGAGRVSVTDGPFAEAKELIDGFAILEVSSKQEAIEYSKRFLKIVGATNADIRLVFEGPGN